MKDTIEEIFNDAKKEVDATLENIDLYPRTFQHGAKMFWLGKKQQLLELEKKLNNLNI